MDKFRTLEASLGVRLLNRTTRQVSLTDAGQRYLVDARRIVEELKEADASVIGLHAKPIGTLSVTAPALFGRLFVTPVMVAYLIICGDMEHPSSPKICNTTN